jgi:hypothetical protein
MEKTARDMEIDRWLDTLAIREQIAEYFRALTKRDTARAQRVFHADAHEQHGPLAGNAHDLTAEIVANLHGNRATVRHCIDAWVEIEGERARSEAGWINIVRTGDQDQFYAGRYLDRWERRAGAWKIAARLATVDFWRFGAPSTHPFIEGAEAILEFSGRGFDDPEVCAVVGLA